MTRENDPELGEISEESTSDLPSMRHIGHRDPNIAYHVEWSFRKEAFLWRGETPVKPNLHPLGTELREWMLRHGSVQVFHTNLDGYADDPYTNVYTHDTSVLIAMLADVMNDSHAFANSVDALLPLDAELKRVRLHSEQVLLTARICEALIKQLLFCTVIPRSRYKRAALGALLCHECPGCRESKELRHKISLLGSLAHRYGLCHEFEACLFKHMRIANRLRNSEAAHSGVCDFEPRTAAASREHSSRDTVELGNDFLHMLQHISDLETRMKHELDGTILAGTSSSWWGHSGGT